MFCVVAAGCAPETTGSAQSYFDVEMFQMGICPLVAQGEEEKSESSVDARLATVTAPPTLVCLSTLPAPPVADKLAAVPPRPSPSNPVQPIAKVCVDPELDMPRVTLVSSVFVKSCVVAVSVFKVVIPLPPAPVWSVPQENALVAVS